VKDPSEAARDDTHEDGAEGEEADKGDGGEDPVDAAVAHGGADVEADPISKQVTETKAVVGIAVAVAVAISVAAAAWESPKPSKPSKGVVILTVVISRSPSVRSSRWRRTD
jgi:hypothetical protein